MKSLTVKLVAVFLAFVIWFFVSAPRREQASERRFAAPLSLVGLPREYIITTPVPDAVSVRLRGRTSDLRSLSSSSLEVPIDLSTVRRAGELSIRIPPQAVHTPPDIEVVAIEQNRLQFTIEQLRQRNVPIRPLLDGQPPPGYVVGEPEAAPANALVSGPLSQIVKMSEVTTERIIMTRRTETFVQNVAVVSDSPLVRVLAPLTTQVTVPILAEAKPEPVTATATTTDEKKSGTQNDESSVRH